MSTVVQLNQLEAQAARAIVDAEGERNIELFRRLVEEGFNKGNLAIVDDVVALDHKEHQFNGPNARDGIEGVKDTIRFCRHLFPDFTLIIEEIIADGDKIWARATMNGTHGGDFLGRPPTGRKVSGVTTFEQSRFENGKMVEHWGVPDRFHMMTQIGLIPAPHGAPAGKP